MRKIFRNLGRAAVPAIVTAALAACSGAGSGGGYGAADPSLTAANPAGGPSNPFLANGQAVLQALDAIAGKSGKPLRVTSMNADTVNGLTVEVQEPQHHVNVDEYVIAPDGTMTGPKPVQLMSLNGGQITAASVDAEAFDPHAIAFARLAQTVREAIARSGFDDARIANWEIDGIGKDSKRYLYLQASRGRPTAEVKPDMTIVRVSY